MRRDGPSEDRLHRACFPWHKGYFESFNARFRDDLLDRDIFTSLWEAQILIDAWHRHYNMARPHGAMGYHPRWHWKPSWRQATHRAPLRFALRPACPRSLLGTNITLGPIDRGDQ